MVLDIPAPALLDETLALAIVRDLVKRNKGMFRAYPDFDREDLEQEAMNAVRKGWGKFNPEFQQSTFITVCARRRLLSLRRDLERRRNRDALAMDVMVQNGEQMGPESLLEWFEDIYQQINQRFIAADVPLRHPKTRSDRPDYPERMALAALHQRTGLTFRAFAVLLRTRPDLLKVIGLSTAPGIATLGRLYRVVPIIEKKFRDFNRTSPVAG